MDVALSSWFVILLALIAANLPFINERLFAIVPLPFVTKPFFVRLFELLTLYGLVGVSGYFLESRIGNVFPQGWEFYAVTACFFIVLAYPGFAYRYLRKHHG